MKRDATMVKLKISLTGRHIYLAHSLIIQFWYFGDELQFIKLYYPKIHI